MTDAASPEASRLAAEVRAGDRTAYLAHLFAPEPARPALLALAAYRLELDRIVERARDPLGAEIRLQWWRDAIRAEGYGETGAALPLITALREAAARYHWAADTLVAISEARIHDLYADPFPDWTAFDGYAGEAVGYPLQLAAMACAVEHLGPERGLAAARTAATAAGHAGVALAAAEAALAFVPRLRRGRTAVPASVWAEATGRDLTAALSAVDLTGADAAVRALAAHGLAADAAMRRGLTAVAPEARAALLPALAARPVLRSATRTPLAPRALPPWRIPWTLWRGARALSAGRAL